jgi:OFA family oxalate/formate antiporter-like MFS transporter
MSMQSQVPADAFAAAAGKPVSYRWMQLFLGIVCMAMIANLQYGWTLFVNPIADK